MVEARFVVDAAGDAARDMAVGIGAAADGLAVCHGVDGKALRLDRRGFGASRVGVDAFGVFGEDARRDFQGGKVEVFGGKRDFAALRQPADGLTRAFRIVPVAVQRTVAFDDFHAADFKRPSVEDGCTALRAVVDARAQVGRGFGNGYRPHRRIRDTRGRRLLDVDGNTRYRAFGQQVGRAAVVVGDGRARGDGGGFARLQRDADGDTRRFRVRDDDMAVGVVYACTVQFRAVGQQQAAVAVVGQADQGLPLVFGRVGQYFDVVFLAGEDVAANRQVVVFGLHPTGRARCGGRAVE